MNFNEYQARAAETAIYPNGDIGEALHYLTPALTAEAGEVAGKWAKVVRDKRGLPSVADMRAMKAELGDVLWVTAMTAHELGYTLEEVATTNLRKLQDRAQRGVLGGSGDNR